LYSFYLFDNVGNPIVGATPAFTAYRSLAGVELTPRPAIVNLASNIYTFIPSASDDATGVAFMVYAATATPQYYAGSVGNLVAIGIWDDTALTPKTSAAPVIDVYVGADATSYPPPVVTNIGLGLYGWLPSSADRTNDVQFRGRTVTAGCIPVNFEGFVASAVGGSSTGPTLLSVTPYVDRIELSFDSNIILSGPALTPAQWPITAATPGTIVPTVTSIGVVGSTVTLYTTECTGGAVYYLHIPASGVTDFTFATFGGPWIHLYVGVGAAPFVALASAQDALHAKVIFSEAVVEAEALVAANYIITGGAGLTVYNVTKETDLVYVLTTSLQVVGQSYTVTVSNIHDMYGNLI
jgi:hypothetical protein